MNRDLLNILVQKNIVTAGTEIEVKYLGAGLDGYNRNETKGTFSIIKIISIDGNVESIVSSRVTDGSILRTTPENIIRIDGMLPEQLAEAFDIQPNGSIKIQKLDEFGRPIKRGRKPKNRLLEGENNERDNRPNKLYSNKIKKPSERQRNRNSEIEATTTRRKYKNRTTSKHKRDAEVSFS